MEIKVLDKNLREAKVTDVGIKKDGTLVVVVDGYFNKTTKVKTDPFTFIQRLNNLVTLCPTRKGARSRALSPFRQF